MAFISSNPCLCNPCAGTTTTTVTPVDCPEVDANCFDLCDVVLTQDNDAGSAVVVGPCGKTGTFDFSDAGLGHNFTLCAGSPVWSVVSYDSELFVHAEIDPSTGVVTWVTGDYNPDKSIGEVWVKATCGKYGAYGKLLIGIKDLCRDVACTSPEVCWKCTGACVDQSSNISAMEGTATVSTGNVFLNAQ